MSILNFGIKTYGQTKKRTFKILENAQRKFNYGDNNCFSMFGHLIVDTQNSDDLKHAVFTAFNSFFSEKSQNGYSYPFLVSLLEFMLDYREIAAQLQSDKIAFVLTGTDHITCSALKKLSPCDARLKSDAVQVAVKEKIQYIASKHQQDDIVDVIETAQDYEYLIDCIRDGIQDGIVDYITREELSCAYPKHDINDPQQKWLAEVIEEYVKFYKFYKTNEFISSALQNGIKLAGQFIIEEKNFDYYLFVREALKKFPQELYMFEAGGKEGAVDLAPIFADKNLSEIIKIATTASKNIPTPP